MHRPLERDALRAAGLVWVGIEARKVAGLAGPRLQLATLVAGLALIGTSWQQQRAYHLRHIGHSLSARVEDFAL